MKKYWIAVLLIFSLLALTGCGCQHEWEDATCDGPKTCTLCGDTQDEKLSHNYEAATCAAPETCTLCGDTQGKKLSHDYEAATCAAPKTCKSCGATQGKALEHAYQGATCDKGGLCKLCGAEGPARGHAWNKATCTKAKTCGRCGLTEGEPLGHTWQEATCTTAKTCTVCQLAEGEAPGHNYVKNVCTVCSEKRIADLDSLASYLNENYHTVHTVLGDVTGVTFELDIKDPVIFEECDFELQIMSTLYCQEMKQSIFSMARSTALPYEDRLQGVADVLDYQLEIIRIVEEAFPGKKFTVYFYDWGWKYPNLQVGFVSQQYLPWRNYKDNNSGIDGYAGTDLCDWHMNENWDTADNIFHCETYIKSNSQFYTDIIKKTGYDLTFKYHFVF